MMNKFPITPIFIIVLKSRFPLGIGSAQMISTAGEYLSGLLSPCEEDYVCNIAVLI